MRGSRRVGVRLAWAAGSGLLWLALVLPAPGAGAATVAWSAPQKVSGAPVASLSCASPSLCVGLAVETPSLAGTVLGSAEPKGGSGSWSSAPIEGMDDPAGVSCVLGPADARLCAVVDCRPQAWTSVEPLGGAGTWGALPVAGLAGCGAGEVPTDVSCPSTSECVGVGSRGSVIHTTDPGVGAWSASAEVDPGTQLNAISCPLLSLCVAADNQGKVLVTTEPLGGKSNWKAVGVDGTTPLLSLSCSPSPTICVAGDEKGNVVASADPAGGEAAWSVAHVGGAGRLRAVSCPSASLCVAVDNGGGAAFSTAPTAGSAAWLRGHVDGYPLESVSCPSTTLCVAGDSDGEVLVGTPSGAPVPGPAGGEPPRPPAQTPETHERIAHAQLIGIESAPGGATTVSLVCQAGGVECGTITAQLVLRVALSGRRVIGVLAAQSARRTVRSLTISSGSLRLAAGASGRLRLRLNATGRAELARWHRLSVRLRVSGGASIEQTRILKLVRARVPSQRRAGPGRRQLGG